MSENNLKIQPVTELKLMSLRLDSILEWAVYGPRQGSAYSQKSCIRVRIGSCKDELYTGECGDSFLVSVLFFSEKIMLYFTIQLSNHLKDLTPSLAWELVFATKTTYQQKRKSHHSHPSSAKVSAIWVSTFCTLGNLEFPSVGRKICQ